MAAFIRSVSFDVGEGTAVNSPTFHATDKMVGSGATQFDNGVNIELGNSQDPILFKLYNIKGQLIVEVWVSERQFLELPNLNSGVYFYKLREGKKVQTGKLIKK